MSKRLQSSHLSSTTNKIALNTNSNVGIVIAVILDDSHELIQDTDSEEFSTGKNTSIVGWCAVRPLSNQSDAETNLTVYPPYDALNLELPLVGETVELIKVGNITHYKRMTRGFINTGNAIENLNRNVFSQVEPETNNAKSYSTTADTGITNTSGKTDRDLKIGEYFESTPINKLKLYEGDKLIQSRFGQSIRFSGYNNAENEFAPSIIIRNRQSAVSLNELKEGDVTEEDINRDGTTIAMVSGKYKLTFQPGTVDDGGSTDFETKPNVFEEYPSELTGYDQLLMSSDRIIFSAKSAEMIFYAKSNWGFISDGVMSIDNGKAGANLDFNGDVRLTTNDFHTYILGGKGYVYLNTESDKEPLVRGNALKDLLSDMIDLIVQQVYPTPAGPTSAGPTNQGDFNKLKSKLDTILSTLNYTE
jgi:hypothetical protein